MKRFFVTLIVFAWFFLVQGYGKSTESTGFSTVVGPFQSREQCSRVAKEAAIGDDRRTNVMFRASSCWEFGEIKEKKKEEK